MYSKFGREISISGTTAFYGIGLSRMAYVMNSTAGLAHTNYLQLSATQKATREVFFKTHTLRWPDVGAAVDNLRVSWWLAEV